MTTVGLVQINQGFSGQSYFPYSVGILEAHARAHLTRPDRYRFLLPVFQRIPVRDAVAQLGDADVAAFSLYVWNEQLSLTVARELKASRPATLIVCGGPQVPDRAEAFLRAHPYVDVVVHGEGEHAFTAILENPSEWRGAPSISYLDGDRLVSTPRAARIADLDAVPSPYLTGVFEPLIAANPGFGWIAMWETNRGCPFSCTFCDWGSAVAAKVNRWSEDRLFREIEWFAAKRIEYVFCADANFGILPRDVEIARYAADVKQRTGYPARLSVQSTKNAEKRVFAVQKILTDAGLNQGVVVSMQSMDPQTLRDIKRANISLDAFARLQQELTGSGIDTMSDLILGLPGETYDSFAAGVATLIENGQHNRIQFNNLGILPNAEMGDPEYQRRYGMESVRSRIINIHGAREEDDEVPEYQQLVIATSTMSREDWVRTRAFAWIVALLHFDKVLQIPLVVARETSGVGYRQLLELFSDGGFERFGDFPVLLQMRAFMIDKARDIQGGGEEYCYSKDFLGIFWPPDELFLIQLVATGRLDAFYAQAEAALAAFAESVGAPLDRALLADAVRLNRALLKEPFQRGNLSVPLGWNVWEVYRGAVRGSRVALARGEHAFVVDRSTEAWDSWDDWSRRVVWWGNKRGAYLYGHAEQPQLAGHY